METADILKTQVTVFPNIKEVYNCSEISLYQWIDECINSRSNARKELIEQIRKETDKHKRSILKNQLPAVVLGATVSNRSANDPNKIKHITGFIAFDIDEQDNPGLTPQKIKEKLKKIDQVIFAGLSASGSGVWGLVKVAYPEKLKQHFSQLVQDFKLIGINLDISKGGNPTDVRFFSYDPEAYLAESYEVYKRLPKIQAKNVFRSVQNQNSIDGIHTAILMINRATDGEKHRELLKASILAGGYIAAGTMLESEAVSLLENAIKSKSNIKSFTNAQKTIKDGINYGKAMPIQKQANSQPNTALLTAISFFSGINTHDYSIELHGKLRPLTGILNELIPQALGGDRKAQKQLFGLAKLNYMKQAAKALEADNACLSASFADAV